MSEDSTQVDILYLAGSGLAVQALLVGLMNALAKRGTDMAVFEEAFEYAAQVAMIGSEKVDVRGAHMLKVVDKLRESVIRDQRPNKDIAV